MEQQPNMQLAEWRPDGSVEDSCTIKLLADTSTTDVLKFSEGTFYLDLNGHTLDVGNNGVLLQAAINECDH